MNKEKSIETIVVLALASLVVSLWLHLSWLNYVAIVLLIISIISKKLTQAINTIWLTFSHYLGMVMNKVLMFVIFYVFLVPISFFQRITGNNQILKKRQGNTYFHQRNHLYTKKNIENPW
jgi:hypothetical protein